MKNNAVRPLVAQAVALAAACAALMAPPPAGATPKHSMRVGQKCSLCHTNPTGGGQRSLYGSQYLLPTRLAMQLGGEREDSGMNPQVGDDVLLGADLRTIWIGDSERARNFAQMQGSVYASMQFDDRFSAYVHQEFGQDQAAAYEIFGLAWVLPGSGYVKVGKFVPAFGWKQADHRTFTRRELVFLPSTPPHSDKGVEVGWFRDLGAFPGEIEIQGSVMNGNFRPTAGGFDPDENVALAGRVSWRWSRDGVNLAAGGSVYRTEGSTSERVAGGPFGGAHWGRVTWLGELDWSSVKPAPGGAGREIVSFTTSQELDFAIIQGLDLVATYDFHDPDVDFESGSAQRVGLGFEAIPFPFLAIRGMVNLFDASPVDPVASPDIVLPPELRSDFEQFVGQVHFFY